MRTGKHEKAWCDFADWCRARRLRPLPAHPWTVAAYARWCEVRHRFPVILRRIRVIARVHLLECVPAPDRHPTVTRTLRMLEVRSRSREARAALFAADDTAAGGAAAAEKRERRTSRGRRRERSLRTSPRLVSRRPK